MTNDGTSSAFQNRYEFQCILSITVYNHFSKEPVMQIKISKGYSFGFNIKALNGRYTCDLKANSVIKSFSIKGGLRVLVAGYIPGHSCFTEDGHFIL